MERLGARGERSTGAGVAIVVDVQRHGVRTGKALVAVVDQGFERAVVSGFTLVLLNWTRSSTAVQCSIVSVRVNVTVSLFDGPPMLVTFPNWMLPMSLLGPACPDTESESRGSRLFSSNTALVRL